MKKYAVILLACLISVAASAQWKVASVADAEPHTTLLQVIETENATLVYATLNCNSEDKRNLLLDRNLYVKANGLKYKIMSSVNLPLEDDGEPRYAQLQKGENEINFVMEFEKFPVEGGFDIIESSEDGDWSFNFHGVKVSPVKESEVLDTKRFLDSGSPVIVGKYASGGTQFLYTIRDGVCVTCNAVIQNGGWSDDEIFYLDIVNDSKHGVMFNFDKVTVVGNKKKGNGEIESKGWAKYTPDSYDQYLQQLDYDEARYNTYGVVDLVGEQLNRDKYNTEWGTWERVGMDALIALKDQAIANRVGEYMQQHPKNRPSALKTESIKAGNAIHGYIASKKKKADEVVLTIPIDGFDFTFTYTAR